MAPVAIRNVRKSFGTIEVIHGVSIDIRDGEFVTLVGPSGCGKSTLLRMIAGLEDISGGDIGIGGRVVNDMPPKERDIAMVFQNYALYPHMTVRDNMGFSLKLRGASKTEIQARCRRAADILGLTPLLERYPRQLSGGQRQRVAMGRAIVRDPQVFLFDEPLSNLDAKLRVQMRTEIKELHQRLKTTTVYVTHDQIEAMTMADKIVVMHDGVVEQMGAAARALRPAADNLFVAGFIGSPAMNFLKGQVTLNGCGMRAHAERCRAAARDGDGRSTIRPWCTASVPSISPSRTTACRPKSPLWSRRVRRRRWWRGSAGRRSIVLLRERIAVRPGETIRLKPDTRFVHLSRCRDRPAGVTSHARQCERTRLYLAGNNLAGAGADRAVDLRVLFQPVRHQIHEGDDLHRLRELRLSR